MLFNGLIIVCILVDSVVVGVEMDSLQGDSIEERLPYWLADIFFAFIFSVEMCVRMHQQGWEYFADPWNIFDYVCVSLGVTSLVQPAGADGPAKDAVNLR